LPPKHEQGRDVDILKKSILLEYVMKCADELRNKDGKKAVSANYFIISLLKVVKEKENNALPEELNRVDVALELTKFSDFLKTHGINCDRAIDDLSTSVHAEAYNPSMDEFIFRKINYTIETRAQSAGKEVIDVDFFVNMIMAEPTEAIRKYFIPAKSNAEESSSGNEESSDQNSPFKKASSETEQEPLPSKTGSAAEKVQPQKAEEANGAASGIQQLDESIRMAQKIQTILTSKIFGQDQAIDSFVSGYFRSELMSQSRKESKAPRATFLFAGPPGVGKTYLAETAAEALGLPFKRFDMSEYSDKEANIEFCGSDEVYKNSKAGNVTSFVSENPRCVLLFDEIEKAHINVIHLFLQLLDAGRLRDNYTDKEVSFTNAIIIFTTNAGKNLYGDPSVTNLSALPRNKVLKALTTDVNPETKIPLFPAAICSRFASGNVVMFNHLGANNLFTIVKNELQTNVRGFAQATGIDFEFDDKVASAIILSEGGKADARTVKGRANAFFHEELYELFRLLSSEKISGSVESLKKIHVDVALEGVQPEIAAMFVSDRTPEVLVFADASMAAKCSSQMKDVVCHVADSIEGAKEILFNHDISIILCDVGCRARPSDMKVLNIEDIESAGQDFLEYVTQRYSLPVYLIQWNAGDISKEEFLSFAKAGVRDVLTLDSQTDDFEHQVLHKCAAAHQQGTMLKLACANKVVTYKTAQTISMDQTTASIYLYDFDLKLAADTEDSKSVLDNISKPDLSFDDVIGAEDAKRELQYFVEYLKNPVKYMRKGVRAPKGILLYGPPGTGKTLLAKAMAGESDVTFLTAEGNQFLKRYVGEGPEAVHALFNAARKYAPSILFVDEIDAIAKERTGDGPSANSADILTAFLTQMDGFNTDTSKPVFVLAATNFDVEPGGKKSLDPALLRRFDRRIYVDLPSKEERKQYLEMKLCKNSMVQLSPEQIDNIALRSTGMSLADLESVFEMALRNAIRSESGIVGDEAFEEAFETFNSGEKKEWNPETLKRVARHEAGHALLYWLSGEKPSYLTIVARGNHGGYMQHGDHEDKAIYTKKELLARIRTSLGGRAAEIAYYGAEDGMSTGASNDLYQATRLAEQMICSYAMDATVGMSYIDPERIDPAIREKVNAILEEQLALAVQTIKDNQGAIDTMVDVLMDKNHLKEKEIDEIFSTNVQNA